MSERLLRLLEDAAGGVPPPADGVVEVWPAPDGPVDAVLAFTAHHVVAAAVDPGPPPAGGQGATLPARPPGLDRPRGAGVLVLGRGLAGRREVSFELGPARRNRGLGRLLVAAARHLTPAGEPLFAQVAPGNAASLQVVEAAGFRPLGAEVLFHRDGTDPT